MFKRVILAGTALAMFLAATPVLADSGSAHLVKDIYPGDSADPWLLTGFGNLVYFQADDGVHGRELWRSDGTEAGTLLVSDGLVGSKSSDPEPLGGAGNYFYFDTKDSVHGRELWRTNADGTASTMVKDLTPGKDSSHFESGIGLGNKYLFDGDASLYATDGTKSGTTIIGPGGTYFVKMGGAVYYVTGSNADWQLMRTDGTAAGTKSVGWTPKHLNFIAATSNRLYMLAGGALWVSDGTKAGTHKLTAPATTTNPDTLITAGDKAYFLDHPSGGPVLWRSNGTAAGTKIMSALPGTANRMYSEGGAAYVPVDMGNGTEQIWVSWGTVNGTHSIQTITTTYGSDEWATLGDTVYFVSYDAYGSNTWILWRTDGTTSGTNHAATGSPADDWPFEVTAAGDKLIFSGDDNVTGREIWAYTP